VACYWIDTWTFKKNYEVTRGSHYSWSLMIQTVLAKKDPIEQN